MVRFKEPEQMQRGFCIRQKGLDTFLATATSGGEGSSCSKYSPQKSSQLQVLDCLSL